MKLYHYWRSSASWRVRWALELKKQPVEKIAVDLLSSQEKSADYMGTNPAGYVPSLVVNGTILSESIAIIEWLEEAFPEPRLLPGTALDRAFIRRLAETVNSGIQPLQNLDVIKRFSEDKERQSEWMRHWIGRGLGVYEKILSSTNRQGAKFSVGNQPTMADLCLIPQCYAAGRNNIDLAQFPQCKAIYEYALTTPECIASSPDVNKP